ncbi:MULTISPECIES: energy transducer TonB [unclassified Neisseria]|uniref:energy transducer TonB n=1 Tax=unclassified Neisseria TaxID=2623750 RepID=UPI002664EA78|nr:MULTISPECIES: energy transducer TonB [unclassified Neisseria]MDO1510627.1 energy transducer TonB [Neisseria sp. MVDL19-042950]MDO1516249.1 energy transducer TonB [Neisseria sp. MVDL18-041461]MDO1564279.1 energy transducer TonB [Neisseria sp. MVDL20-010259]
MKKYLQSLGWAIVCMCVSTFATAQSPLPTKISKKAKGYIIRPQYPPIAIENKMEGKVILSVLVAPGGRVMEIKLLESSGHEQLDKAAEKAARIGRFETEKWTEYFIPFTFKIDEEEEPPQNVESVSK